MQHIPHLRMPSSVVQRVLNLGTRMAAAISSGSASISPKRCSSPARRAFTKGPQYLEVVWRLWSLDLSSVMVGTSQPSCTLASPWRRLTAFATWLMVFAYSVRNAILAGVNLSNTQTQRRTKPINVYAVKQACMEKQCPQLLKLSKAGSYCCLLSHKCVMALCLVLLPVSWQYQLALQVITHCSVQVEEQQ